MQVLLFFSILVNPLPAAHDFCCLLFSLLMFLCSIVFVFHDKIKLGVPLYICSRHQKRTIFSEKYWPDKG